MFISQPPIQHANFDTSNIQMYLRLISTLVNVYQHFINVNCWQGCMKSTTSKRPCIHQWPTHRKIKKLLELPRSKMCDAREVPLRAIPFEILRWGGADWRRKKMCGGSFAEKIKSGGGGMEKKKIKYNGKQSRKKNSTRILCPPPPDH